MKSAPRETKSAPLKTMFVPGIIRCVPQEIKVVPREIIPARKGRKKVESVAGKVKARKRLEEDNEIVREWISITF